MTNETSWVQTIAATFVCIVVYFFLLYFVAPIVEYLVRQFGIFFVPNRFGGGSEVDNLGILNLAFRMTMASGLSACAAFIASASVCSNAHAKTVAIVFALAITVWALLFVDVGDLAVSLMPLFKVLITAATALVVALCAWYGDFWR